MLKLNKDQKRLPLGGHHFYENGLMIRGETLSEVDKKLGEFRLNNNRPMGRPDQDILTYYAVNFPWMVKEDTSEVDPEPVEFIGWRDWVQKTWIRPPKKTLTTKEATYRWDVCKVCPHNVPIKPGHRTAEFDQLKRKTFMLRRGAKIPSELGYCSLHRFDLGVATFIETPKDHSEIQKDTPNYPSCWV